MATKFQTVEAPKFLVEKNIPIPATGRSPIYPWGKLEVGDSFFIECSREKRPHRQTVASVASKRYAPKKFTARTLDGGVRIWRVK